MWMEDVEAVMENTKEVLKELERIKTEAKRKATVKVNAVMAELTRLVSRSVVSHLEMRIEKEFGERSARMREIREMG